MDQFVDMPLHHVMPSESSLALVDALINRDRPAFLFDDTFHFGIRHHNRHTNFKNMQPVVKFMLSVIAERVRQEDRPVMLVPEAITNGKLYYDLAQNNADRIRDARGGILTTYRMAEILSSAELAQYTEKNKNRAMSRLEGFQKFHSDSLVISPTGMEAFLKSMLHEQGFTNGQHLRDEDFETFWIGVCYLCQQGGFADEVAYSRNGNFETFSLFLNQYGVVPFRPDGGTDIYFPANKLVRPADYMQMLYDHITDVIPRGFLADLPVKMAVRMMMLEDMRVHGLEHPYWGGLDESRINPKLMDLPKESNEEFEDISSRFLSFMERHHLDMHLQDRYGFDINNGYDRAGDYAHERLERIREQLFFDLRVERSRLKQWCDTTLDMRSALKDANNLHDLSFQQPFQLEGRFFNSPPALFDEGHYAQCSKREQIALHAMMGLWETPQKKQNPSEFNHVLVLFDRRAGTFARTLQEETGVLIVDEARGLSDSFSDQNFEERVKSPTIKRVEQAREALSDNYPKAIITTSEQIENLADSYQHHHEAIRELGPSKMKGHAKVALVEEVMTRGNAVLVTDSDWANSAYLTFARLHARKIQMGLVSRPDNVHPYGVLVSDYSEDGQCEPASFVDDFKTLTREMRMFVDAGAENYPRHLVKGLMEMIVMADMYYNDNVNRLANIKNDEKSPLVDWQSVPQEFKAALEDQKEDFLVLKREAKAMILAHGMNALSHDDVSGTVEKIDRDYLDAKNRQDVEESLATSRTPKGREWRRRSKLTA